MPREGEPGPQPNPESRKLNRPEAQDRAEKQTERARRSAAFRESFPKLSHDEQFVLVFPPSRSDDPEYQAEYKQAREKAERLFQESLRNEDLEIDKTDYKNAAARLDRIEGEGSAEQE